ncbi:FecR domain-containing protein [Gammaproteobacteria bacterium]|nr:FecR domain-containing protein [Gammaproteobacteria bacterium]
MTNSSPHHIALPRSAQHRQGCGRLRRLGLALLTPLALSFSLSFSLIALQATAQTTNSVRTPTAVVGEVSLVLGRAYLERDNDRERIEAGSKVHVGDRVFTEAGGHVHVRFVDDALVSVRPSSTLDVVRYDYDAVKPENSAVKFELSEGVARAISGDAAKSARQRFRMNTPIAAIGVRGTDFVVSANSRSTRALVNEGAIIMAPYSSECSSDALGPCSVDAVELSQNTLQVLELGSGNPAPRLIAATAGRELGEVEDASNNESNSAEAQVVSTESPDALDTNEVYLESIATTKINTEVAAAESGQGPDEQPIAPVVSEIPVVLADFTSTTALTAESTRADQLVWGRWSSNGSPSLLSLSLSDAREGRDVTIASPSGFILYRNEPNGASVESGLGVVKFDLSVAEAFYDSANGIVAMRVAGGNLELDFVDRAFATELNLDHAATGAIDFTANGAIADGGYLLLREDSKIVSGAVATDGSAAGYFFEEQLEAGRIQGITLWGAQ